MSESPAESEPIVTHPVAPRLAKGTHTPHVGPDLEAYRKAHGETVGEGSDEWWATKARQMLHWDRPFQTVRSGGFATGDIAWFPEGGLNAAYNCVDRYAFSHPDRVAIIYEADEPGTGASITYAELLREVCSLANVLSTTFGVKKGDTVSIYLPMTWHAAAAFLACARIGAIHSVVFAGFSAESLRDRVNDCASRVLITSDEGRRGGKVIATKAIVDSALKECPAVEHCLVLKRTGDKTGWTEGRDRWWHEEVAKVPSVRPEAGRDAGVGVGVQSMRAWSQALAAMLAPLDACAGRASAPKRPSVHFLLHPFVFVFSVFSYKTEKLTTTRAGPELLPADDHGRRRPTVYPLRTSRPLFRFCSLPALFTPIPLCLRLFLSPPFSSSPSLSVTPPNSPPSLPAAFPFLHTLDLFLTPPSPLAHSPPSLPQTSGSTGKPKGVVHTTGGYLLCAALTVKYVFDVHEGDIFACMADVGWITGHTYIIYGPLLNGVTTLMFESTPVYPSPARYWETVCPFLICSIPSGESRGKRGRGGMRGRDEAKWGAETPLALLFPSGHWTAGGYRSLPDRDAGTQLYPYTLDDAAAHVDVHPAH
ncbi:Acetyl-coenzyme A synthetase [Mycena venus]|uniref:acetate--CoA ligase n=1 Tax=Mycena venus TaxID=2733690 RepID=A0A8H6XMP0_9AGAR|nr:Acetyl-coenzyme A synthetase [Mycena venus]